LTLQNINSKPAARPTFSFLFEHFFVSTVCLSGFLFFAALTWREQVPAAHAQGEDSLGARVTSMFEHASRLDDGEQGRAAAAAVA
jgi:hypothetical protein